MVRRVFLSHTSEFAIYPKDKSFVDIAVEAVIRAECMPCDMGYFTARDQQPAQYCIDRVRECDVYVGIIGLRYGSPVRDRPEVSYTELEFEAASRAPAKTRLIFVLAPNAVVPAAAFTDMKFGERQERFRKKLSDSGIMCKSFTTFHELDNFLLHALMEAGPVASGARQKLERIEWPEGKSPYPGLEWFDQEYAPLFFGRDGEVDQLIGKLKEPGGRFLIISGPSGSGKSSLVAAGLWQALIKKGQLPGSLSWRWLRITPAADSRGPFASLAAGLQHAFPQMTAQADDLACKLASDPTALARHIIPQMSQGQELVLFVDQLEELFTQAFPSAEIQSFLACLVTFSGDLQNRLRVITTIRSEFFGRLAETEPVRRTINLGFHVLVGPLSPIALRDMIQKPAAVIGYTFESGLVDTILNDVGKEPGHLPLVAYALKQLFELREQQNRTFTHAAYQTMGGVVGAIGSKADQMIATLEQQSSASFDRVFAELVHIERDRPPTCNRASLSYFKDDEEANKVIQVLAGRECRVLVTADDKQETTVEVAHEKLFSAWTKLKDWIDDNGEDLRDIDFQEEAARRWFETGSHLKELWRLERAQKVEKALARFKKTRSSQLDALLRPQPMLINRLDDASLSHHDRLLIGQTLAEFGDPRDGVGVKHGLPAIVWIDVPEGEVTLEGIDREFRVKPFRIAQYPVTNDQFNAFLRAEDGYDNDEWWKDIERSLRRKDIERSGAQGKLGWLELNCPREMVSWYDAVAFCRWLSAKTAAKVRLPTEWEWQQAATGGDPRREYPWKGEWDSSLCNNSLSQLSRTTAVGMYPLGATPHGILDMAGNVWEWCLNTYDQLDTTITTSGERVLRGDSWLTDPEISNRWAPPTPRAHRVSNRFKGSAEIRSNDFGFRLAQDIKP
jgi:formylglycine-generating enzyme required for sulfatase activity